MSEFKEYQHIERFGNDEVDGIEMGLCYVFPKIDGTNGSVWHTEDGGVGCGSRHRMLSIENDNAGFMAHVVADARYGAFISKYPSYRLFGEWLVPHSLMAYRESAWRKFYVFDVECDGILIPYDEYEPMLKEFGLDYIVPLCKVENPTEETLVKNLDLNKFLIDGDSVGEGIVIKNYEFRNKFGRQTWAKIVRQEFKELHIREMGINGIKEKKQIEEYVAGKYITLSLVEKEVAKIINEKGGWNTKYIPMLLGIVWYVFIKEELWDALKDVGMCVIDFKRLNRFVTSRIKSCIDIETGRAK